MVWKNFKIKKSLTIKTKLLSGGKKVPTGAVNSYLPRDGVIRPSDSRKKLTFIEKINLKRLKKEKSHKNTKIGDEVLVSSPRLKVGRIYNNVLGKTIRLIFDKNNISTSNYIQNSLKVIKDRSKEIKDINKKPLVFDRFFNIKTILFRSFWIDKFINTLVVSGRKLLVWKTLYSVFLSLKVLFMRSPSILIFEILENFKSPLKALPPKNKTRKVIVRVHLVSWWKQYMQILRWIRQSTRTSHRMKGSWEKRILSELTLLVKNDRVTSIAKKIELNNQLVAFGRVSIHFRWHKRYSKRKIKLNV